MAEDLDDGEFWLPPQFLTDDDLLRDFNAYEFKNNRNDEFSHGFGYGFFGPNSDLSSPVESVVGSTETESDEDDYISGLTRKIAHSTLEDASFPYEKSKGWGLSGSPQSTLCSVLGGCGCKQGSSRGSPTCVSQISSPPSLGRKDGGAALDLLYAAAGEVARMRMVEEANGFYSSNRAAAGFLGPPRKPSPVTVPLKNPNQNHEYGFYPNQTHLTYQQLQATQFQQLKQQQMMKQQQQGSGIWGQNKGGYHAQHMIQNRGRNGGVRPQGLSMSAWPTLQQSQQQQSHQPPGSGMRAVFLGNPNTKRECTGTGVFLPRKYGTPTDTRKKQACSTVLLPDRVVHALNLNLESMETQPQLATTATAPAAPPRGNLNFAAEYAVGRNNAAAAAAAVLMAQQRRNSRPQQVASNQELRLPQEWTY